MQFRGNRKKEKKKEENLKIGFDEAAIPKRRASDGEEPIGEQESEDATDSKADGNGDGDS